MDKRVSLFICDTSNAESLAAPVSGRGSGLASRALYQLLSSSASIQETSRRLIRMCELAFGHRDFDALESVSQLLCSLPHRTAREFGLYYQAIIAHKAGRQEQAQAQLEPLAHNSALQSRAQLALASFHHKAGRPELAVDAHAQILSSGNDLFAVACALFNLSAASSASGKHNNALKTLRQSWPIVRQVARLHPHVFFAWHNEIAYELLQLGKVEDAKRAASVAVASPIAAAYPEWQETAQEIQASERRAILVVVPARKQTVTRIQPVGRIVRRKAVKLLIRRAPVVCSIVERVCVCAPIHGPPFHQS